MELQAIKRRFGIIGNSPQLNKAIHTARQVAPADITVLITGESGTGKESFPKIVHQLSLRKHGPYIAVNCGAIPEGTIDSELFGHEKGSFTGATESRKGYFEEANGGTIFLDEVAELPLSTQVRLLRVLESGEFLRVGSSKVIKTDVRVVAASNVHIPQAISNGKFREDLYYRLSTVPIYVPPLRDRGEDIVLLFRKFATDFAEKFKMPGLRLTEDAKEVLKKYRWPGNVRQLKNITEQISVIEQERMIDVELLYSYLPDMQTRNLPVVSKKDQDFSERDILYKVLFDVKNDLNELKKLVYDMISDGNISNQPQRNKEKIMDLVKPNQDDINNKFLPIKNDESELNIHTSTHVDFSDSEESTAEVIEESLSLEKSEIEIIKKALKKYNGKRKEAASELGISERTLYRKLKEYNIEI